MKPSLWMLAMVGFAALAGGCAPDSALQFTRYAPEGETAGPTLEVRFQDCYSEIRGRELRVVCRQETVRTRDPITGEPLETPVSEEVIGGLIIARGLREDWRGFRPVREARFQWVRSDGAGWLCGADSGRVQFGGVVGGRLGIQFGIECDRLGPAAPDTGWAYCQVSGLLTPRLAPEKVQALWPKVFHDGN